MPKVSSVLLVEGQNSASISQTKLVNFKIQNGDIGELGSDFYIPPEILILK